MYYKRSVICLLLLALALAPALAEESWLNRPDSKVRFQGSLELGFLSVVYHTIQFGQGGTEFDYVNAGGQNVFFPFKRISAEVELGPRHKVVFLYQPIDVRTEVQLTTPLTVYLETFPADTPMELRYGFDFYRISYLFDFWKDPRHELAAGLSLQVRDAVIVFADKAGTQMVANQNLGPVPILKFRVKRYLGPVFWLGSEIDGFYASGRFITGSANDFVGAILDASLRAGFTPKEPLDVFLNVRYLGGGAVGTEQNSGTPGDGYTRNWLNTLSVSLGVTVR